MALPAHSGVVLDAQLSLLTSVSPAHDGAWRQFAGEELAVLPPDPAAIDRWWRAVQTPPGVFG